MKKTWLLFILIFLLFSGCPNHFQMPEKAAVPKGYGTVRISFAGEAWQARTVYPSTNAFDKIEYFFTKEGGSTEEKFPENGLFTLETGTWTVEVKAYIDGAYIAGGQETFSAGSGSAVNVTITLSPTDDALSGSGAFTFNISFPEDAAITEFNLYNLLSPNNTINLMPAVMPAETMLEYTETDIPAGYYLLTLTMTKNGRNSGRNEIVHIYGSMPSTYTAVFEDIDFINTPPTAPENLKAVNGDGQVTLHWDIPVFKGSSRTIVVEMLCSTAAGWSEDKALRIVVNGVTITDTARADGASSKYSFPVNPGDIIQFYWLTGTSTTGQTSYAFIAYCEDAPPNPEFTYNSSYNWNGSNALLYQQRQRNSPLGLMNVTNNTLLGSFFVGDESVTGYEVSYSADDGATWSVPKTANASPYTVTGLSNGTNYTFRVSAVNDAGPGIGAYISATPDEPRTIVVEMYIDDDTTYWNSHGATLGITVNGVQIENNLRIDLDINNNNPPGQRFTNTYNFDFILGNEVEFFLVRGGGEQYRSSFIVYYADNPPDPPFFDEQLVSPVGPYDWKGQNALLFRNRGRITVGTTLDGITPGAVLGSFTVGAPSEPQNFTATPWDGQAVLTWTAPVYDSGFTVTGYQLTWDNWGPSTVTLGANASSYTFTGLNNGQLYTFKIRATNAIGNGSEAAVTTAIYDSSRIKKAEFTGDTATVNFDNLSGNDIYLVKMNTSTSLVSAANTGTVVGITPSLFQGISLFNVPETELPIMGHPEARELSEKPAPKDPQGFTRPLMAFIPPEVGDTRMFLVETYYNSGSYIQKQATLRATGQHGNIWVMDENYTSGSGSGNLISSSQAQLLSDRFDIIYPAATNILGYEYGGGPGGDGGRDGDPKIQILIYSILNQSGGVAAAGYFHSKDYSLTHQGSNQTEMFYIDVSQINNNITYISSTLIHELQHMIHYNMKNIRVPIGTATWYDEMLSIMSQDVINALIGIGPGNSSHVIRVRMPLFLAGYYQVGMTEWIYLASGSYAKGFAFGAYLMRNYGGPELLSKMLHNNTTQINSVTEALKEMYEGMDFYLAFRRFAEAMIFSGPSTPAGAVTFDKTVTSTINGTTYTASGFDIWTDFTQKGPTIFTLTQRELRPYSLTIHSDNTWKNITGTASITLEKPLDPNVEFYLMAR